MFGWLLGRRSQPSDLERYGVTTWEGQNSTVRGTSHERSSFTQKLWPQWMEGEYKFILVTNNASDFRQLYGMQPIHPSLIIILPNVERPMQGRLFRETLTELKAVGELVNRVIEVGLDGDEVTLNSYELPAGDL